MRWRHLLALLLLVATVACKDASPEDAFRAFTLALSKGETERAWDMFSADTRQQLDALLKAQRQPGDKAPAHAVLFERGLLRASREIVGIEVLTQSRGRAVLRVSDEEGEQQQVTMLLEEGAWKVHLELPGNPT